MSSPARSSATSAGQGGGGGSSSAAFGDDIDRVSLHESKEETLAVLKLDMRETLQKAVKSLDEDGWMFAGPRSQIHQISRPGANIRLGVNAQMQTKKHGEANYHFKQTRHTER